MQTPNDVIFFTVHTHSIAYIYTYIYIYIHAYYIYTYIYIYYTFSYAIHSLTQPTRTAQGLHSFEQTGLGIDEVAWDGLYRATWNPDATGFPCAICSVQSVAEVQRVVKYAAQHCVLAADGWCIRKGESEPGPMGEVQSEYGKFNGDERR